MRTAFINILTKHAAKNDKIYLLTGDLGFSVFEPFAAMYPERFINAGIAEANMIGIASGLARSGKTALAYSIIPFSVSRCLEQIKVDICYQNADVKIIGVGAGYAYGTLGVTHQAIEDIALMRAYPNMKVLSPCDARETEACIELALNRRGPFYVRLGKNGEPGVLRRRKDSALGGSNVIKEGRDAAVFVAGPIAYNVLLAAGILEKQGISLKVVSMYSVKPIDKKAVLDACDKMRLLFTVEEHTIVGGLGGAVSEVLAEDGKTGFSFKRIGIPDVFCEGVGSRDYLLDKYGLSAKGISETIMGYFRKHIKGRS